MPEKSLSGNNSPSESASYDTSDEENERTKTVQSPDLPREADVSTRADGVKEHASEHPPPSVYLCLDIEATCDGKYVTKNGDPRARLFDQSYENEILEIPVEAVDAKSGRRLSLDQPSWAFHTYVSPKKKPSRFCTELTGIDAEKLRKAPPLATALQRLEVFIPSPIPPPKPPHHPPQGWLRRRNLVPWPLANTKEAEVNYIWVTDGSWDFGKFLWHDCRRKGLAYPFSCNAWCDAREAFRATFPKIHIRPPMLQNMVKEAGLTWFGPPHRGEVDTKNLAALVGVIARCNPTALLPSRCLPYDLIKDVSYYRPGYFSNPQPTPRHFRNEARIPPAHIPGYRGQSHEYYYRREYMEEYQYGAYRGQGACYYDVPYPEEGHYQEETSNCSGYSRSTSTPPPPPLIPASSLPQEASSVGSSPSRDPATPPIAHWEEPIYPEWVQMETPYYHDWQKQGYYADWGEEAGGVCSMCHGYYTYDGGACPKCSYSEEEDRHEPVSQPYAGAPPTVFLDTPPGQPSQGYMSMGRQVMPVYNRRQYSPEVHGGGVGHRGMFRAQYGAQVQRGKGRVKGGKKGVVC